MKAVSEKRLDLVLETEPHYGHGNHGQAYFQEIIRLVVVPELEDTLEDAPYGTAEHHDRAEHGGEVHGDGEIKKALSVNPEQGLENHKMTAAADRQELCKPLHYAQHECFPQLHHFSSLSFLSRNSPAIAMPITTMPASITSGAATSLRALNIA